jgi:hypothetical protein
MWYGIGLAEVPHGMDKFNLSATWHGLGLAYVPCGILA